MAHTTWQAAYQETQSKVNEKMKETVESHSFKSLGRLSSQLGTSLDDTPEMLVESAMPEVRGENKVLPHKKGNKKKPKHRIMAAATKTRQTEERTKRKPRFFCEF